MSGEIPDVGADEETVAVLGRNMVAYHAVGRAGAAVVRNRLDQVLEDLFIMPDDYIILPQQPKQDCIYCKKSSSVSEEHRYEGHDRYTTRTKNISRGET